MHGHVRWPGVQDGGSLTRKATSPPAVAGYPHLTVPMGFTDGLPVGLSFIGPAWSEARLLQYAHAYEQAAKLRRPPTYRASSVLR